MFTGLVQHVGTIISIDARDWGVRLVVDAGGWSHTPTHGESIAVNGCCLTIADEESDNHRLLFDVIHESLNVTTLGDLAVSDQVNLEASVTPTTMLGGHIVQGHVDGVADVVSITREGGEHRVRVRPPIKLMHCIIEKGSVALDGVSLTVAAVGDDWLDVALIPTTLGWTTLGQRSPGDRMNVETDYVAKIVARQLATQLQDNT